MRRKKLLSRAVAVAHQMRFACIMRALVCGNSEAVGSYSFYARRRTRKAALEQIPSDIGKIAMLRVRDQDADESPATVKRPRVDSGMKNDVVKSSEIEISRGAEGLVTRILYLGRLAVRKERFPKQYRHPELDAKLTSRRLSQEARVLLRLRKSGIRVPAVYHVDLRKNVLILEYLPGMTLKAFLQQGNEKERGKTIMMEAGREVARMHKCDVVHGDLTTGNIMVLSSTEDEQDCGKGDVVCMIDFGLSSGGGTDEDMAVDLYVLERAVISAHSEAAQPLNDAFMQAYAQELNRPSVIKRLADVRARGRKRDMTG